ncbi:hypothetical protein F2Q70_00022500 [Brassica cretica]|uniref:Uncharacterized protein n=1 Tax=Brassica cretica TaxID=69181 RepID=A0A8S9GF86_BRACR|nr:hypothetical protein F2Q70_00022500 [Brassica cretica]
MLDSVMKSVRIESGPSGLIVMSFSSFRLKHGYFFGLYGERREGQYGRSQGIQGARGSDKGKGIAREKQGHHKQDSAYHPYKEKFARGYGEGSYFYGSHNGYGNKKTAFQSMDSQQQQRQDAGEHRPLNPTKRMLDAFKGVTGSHGPRGVKGIGTEGSSSSSKARKSLSFEEAVPEVQSEEMGQEVAVLKDGLALQEQAELDAEAKVATEQSLHSEALDEANLMIDGVILSDSELLVEGGDLEDWEQGEIMDFAEEDGLAVGDQDLGDQELGDQELGDQEMEDQELGVQEHSDPVDEVTAQVPENKSGEVPNDEKASKKKEMKQEAVMTGGAKKRVGQAFASPRKKLLAKWLRNRGTRPRRTRLRQRTQSCKGSAVSQFAFE